MPSYTERRISEFDFKLLDEYQSTVEIVIRAVFFVKKTGDHFIEVSTGSSTVTYFKFDQNEVKAHLAAQPSWQHSPNQTETNPILKNGRSKLPSGVKLKLFEKE
ncbi:hypothetical protein [Vibrio splendidus]|uniref:hypothetical protein n=1 Tax=Vibrio splendidus TaxID=29497 RepID=UPI003D13F23A